MNRKKKINKILGKKMRKANAKLAPKDTKPAYVSKAEREKLAEQANSEDQNTQPEDEQM